MPPMASSARREVRGESKLDWLIAGVIFVGFALVLIGISAAMAEIERESNVSADEPTRWINESDGDSG